MNILDMDDLPDRPRKTALQKLHEDMERQLRPIRQMQELIDRASPGYQLKKLMDQYEPYRQLEDLMRRSAIPKHIQDMLDSTSALTHAQRLTDQLFPRLVAEDALARAMRTGGLDTVSQAIKRHEDMMRPLVQHEQWLEKLQHQAFGGLSATEFSRRLDALNPTLRIMEDARRAFGGVLDQLRDVDLAEFEADDEDEEEAREVLNGLAEAPVDRKTFQEAIDRLIAVVKEEKRPAVKMMLCVVLLKLMDWIMSGLIGTIMSFYSPAVLGEPPQAAKKAVNETARAVVPSPELLTDFRYVSAKVLIVRQNPRARSPEIARLNFGKPVKLVKKEKDFALVLWTDPESGAQVQGWVFARYLSKFR